MHLLRIIDGPMNKRIADSLLVCVLAVCGCSAAANEASIWLEDGRLTAQARELLLVLADAESYGLEAGDYRVELASGDLDLSGSGVGAANQAAIDAALTQAASRFLSDVHSGRVDPRAAGFDFSSIRAPLDVAAVVRNLANASDVRGAVAAVEPRPRPYVLLKQALARYRELARTPDLVAPARAAGPLGKGDEYAGAPQLRRLLAALGDLDAHAGAGLTASAVIDADLAAALRRFQRRHGLEQDGVLGKRTYAALATPLTRRVRQIELTLERWRWTTALERPDIVVNVPQFMLYALRPAGEPGGPVLETPVIVGRNAPHLRTPVFTAAIERVVFRPYWDVPRGITVRELLPQIRKDVRYLERNDMEIVRGAGDDAPVVAPAPEAIESLARGELRLRQRPGAKNALGAVKFVLPNPYSVYLHATPAAELFGRSRRAYSHGCIRVSEPAQLAAFVLKNAPEPWTPEAIAASMCGASTQTVMLRTPVRVLVFYSTVAATESEGLLFAADLYGHDARLEQLLRDRGAVR
jgi:murein L,D-transpeptidase YcbB/YkuD